MKRQNNSHSRRLMSRCRKTGGCCQPTLILFLFMAFLCSVLQADGLATNTLATCASTNSISGGGGSYRPSFSADGRHLVFLSCANNLVTNDDRRPWLDAFVHDLVTTQTTLVTVNSNGFGGLDADAMEPSISDNGRFVAFQTRVGNLAFDGTNSQGNVFRRDLVLGITTPISLNTNSVFDDLTFGNSPVISSNGNCVLFESRSINLTADSNLPGGNYIYLRDVSSNLNSLASFSSNRCQTFNYNNFMPAMTPDGRWVAYVGYLFPGASLPCQRQIHVWDRLSNTTVCVTALATNLEASLADPLQQCYNPKISADGRFVVFNTAIRNQGSTGNLWRYDMLSNSIVLVGSNAFFNLPPKPNSQPCMSADGNVIIYEQNIIPDPQYPVIRLYCWNAATGSNTLVDVNIYGTTTSGFYNGSHASMNADGTKVAFVSFAGNLVSQITNELRLPQIYLRDLSIGKTYLLSTNPAGQIKGDYTAVYPVLSPDGTLVAFDSTDDTLVPGDNNQESDVFVKDLATGQLRLISRRVESLPSASAQRSSYSLNNVLSADGRYLAFAAADGSLVPNDTNGIRDIFVRDLQTGSNAVVNISTNTLKPAKHDFQDFQISADGRFVLFSTLYANAFEPFLNFPAVKADTIFLYLRDLQLGTATFLAEVNSGSSFALSPDGRYVAFASRSNNLVSDVSVTGTNLNVYLRDLQANTNLLISFDRAGNSGGDGDSFNPQFSPDGRRLTFESCATSLDTNATFAGSAFLYLANLDSLEIKKIGDTAQTWSPGASLFKADFTGNSAFVLYQAPELFRYDISTASNLAIGIPETNFISPSISGDGLLVSYGFTDDRNSKQIALKNLATSQSQIITSNYLGTALANGDSTRALLTADGRYLVFQSMASDLVSSDSNDASDIFVRDLVHGNTFIVSASALGSGPGAGASHLSTLGADGRTIVFHSFAENLVPNDFNGNGDLFILRLGTDSDHDGLDDEWEIAWFGSLDRTGAGDFDGDGLSDAAEFKIGSNPTNGKSCLAVFTLSSVSGNARQIFWSGLPGRNYRLQYKDSLSDTNWLDLPGPIAFAAGTAAMTDPLAPPKQRFYRVIVE